MWRTLASCSRLLPVAITCLMLLVCSSLSSQRAYAKPVQEPAAVANEFYGWYLKALAADQVPLTAERSKLAVYVSKDLITEIERQIKSADGIGEDYFLKSQDYLDEWQSARHTSGPIQRGSASIVKMTLGSNRETMRTLRLTMIREDGAWKIRRVASTKTVP